MGWTMTRSRRAGQSIRRFPISSGLEPLEGRSLLSGISFLDGLGVGASGSYAAIRSNAVATDAAGDSYITGSFRGTAGFDPSSSANTISTSSTQDTFVAKYSPTGALLWVTTFAGQATTNSGGFTTYAVSQGSAIAVDGSGNVFVAGSFNGTVNVTEGSGVTSFSSATSATEPYVARLGASGGVTWFVPVGGTAYDTDSANALALDGSGGVVIGGSFAETANFGATALTASGSSDAFVARLNASGSFLWAVATQGVNGSNAAVNGVAVDGSGHVTLAGFFSGAVDFDPSSSQTILTSVGSDDAMLWKLDALGHFVWSRSYGSPDYDAATAVAVDASGNIFTTGAFSDSVNFGGSGAGQTITASPTYDGFLLKVDPNGNTLWVDGLVGASGSAKGQGVGVDSSGSVHVAGTFAGPLSFSSTVALTSVASNDVFLAGYDPGGNLVYALQAGQTQFNASLGLAVNPTGRVTITGSYSGSIVFGPSTLPSHPASFFVAQALTQFPPPTPPSPVLEAGSDSGMSNSDRITNVTSPVLDLTASVATDTVELLRNGVVVAQRTGTGPLTDPGPAPQGSNLYTAIEVSSAGLASPPSSATAVTILTTPPAVLPAPTLDHLDDSGILNDGITNVKQPRLDVMTSGSLTVQLLNAAGSVIGSAFEPTAGTGLVTPSQAFADGVYALRVRAVDVAGNVGPASPVFNLTIDATAPVAPSILSLLAADDSGTVGDNLTNVRQPRLTGTAEPGSTVQVVDSHGNLAGSTVAAGDGTFTVKLFSPLADGTYTFSARATDAAGNQGPLGPSRTLTILATPPASPSSPSLLAADDSGTVGDRITNVRQPRLTGAATPGVTVEIVNAANVVLGSATATSGGTVTVAPSSPLVDGTYALTFIAVDAAGNLSQPGSPLNLTILGTPPPQPQAPGLLAIDDTGVIGDGMTSVRRPILVGTAAPGGRIDWLTSTGSVLTSTTASAQGGAYQLLPPTALINGVYAVKVRETDVAGNVSLTSPTFNLTVRADPGDDFGDSQTDISIYRSTDSYFFVQKPTTGALFLMAFGGPGDVPINGDFFGNGHNDIAVYRPSTSTFFAEDPVTGATRFLQLGQVGSVPVPADYDGDGQTDFAVFNLSTSTFTIQNSATNTVTTRAFGGAGDIPVPGDYFGNGHADLAIYRPSNSTFYIYDPIVGTTRVVTVGLANSTPVPADYEGLGHLDPAVYQTGNSTYVIQMSATNTTYSRSFGAPGDLPVPGDYLGNGRADLAVYRASTATFYALDIPTFGSKVVAWGTPNVTRPTLAPITTWFSFGPKPSRNALPPANAPALPVAEVALVPLLTDLDGASPFPILLKPKNFR